MLYKYFPNNYRRKWDNFTDEQWKELREKLEPYDFSGSYAMIMDTCKYEFFVSLIGYPDSEWLRGEANKFLENFKEFLHEAFKFTKINKTPRTKYNELQKVTYQKLKLYYRWWSEINLWTTWYEKIADENEKNGSYQKMLEEEY